jgi:hypothetical protein
MGGSCEFTTCWGEVAATLQDRDTPRQGSGPVAPPRPRDLFASWRRAPRRAAAAAVDRRRGGGQILPQNKQIQALTVMIRILVPLVAVTALAACDGNPFMFPGNNALLPGSENPQPDEAVIRRQAIGPDGQQMDEAFDPRVTHDPVTDVLTLENVPFDGDGTYRRDGAVPSLNGFNVYENVNTTERRTYQAIRGESASGNARLMVVRTGDYLDYGFGGLVYERDLGVVLPTTGQATYEGNYAGMRVFNNAGGLQYTRGDASLEIDFTDFEESGAIEGRIRNREIFSDTGAFVGTLPVLVFRTSYQTEAGEFTGDALSTIVRDGRREVFEEGKYYGVISGTDADEIVGVVVVEATDLDNREITIQESGGFILDRQ